MKAAGQDPAEARAKVKAWERRKSDFVLNRSALLSSKNEDKIFDIVSPFKNVSFSTLTVEEAQEHINQAMTLLEKETEKMDEPYGLVFGYQCHTAPVKVDRTSRIPFSYHADVDAVVVNPFHDYFAKYDFSGAMLHELAHRYDWTVVCSWKNEGIKNALTAAKEYATIHVEELKTIVSQHLDDFPAQDLVSIISDRAVNTTAAHNKLSYSSEVREAFADLASMRAFNASSYHNISKIFPDVTATFEKIFNGDD